MMFATAVMGPSPSGGGAFDPLSLAWHSAFYAEGPDFVALGLADTDAVTTWPNETGETDGDYHASYDPAIFVASGTINGQPALRFGSSFKTIFRVPSFTTNPDYSSGVSIVIIADRIAGASRSTFVDAYSGSTNNNNLVGEDSGAWLINAGTVQVAPAYDDDPHLLVAFFDGSTGNDTLAIDGATVIDADAGAEQLVGLNIGANSSNSNALEGDVCFVGIYEGDVTADGNWSAFESWVASHYGITIS